LYHAYKANDFVYVGRQALLDEIKWGANGWPTINEGRGPSVSAASPLGAPDRAAEYSFFDEFVSRQLTPGWQWPQGNEPDVKLESRNGGQLVLASSSASQSKVEMLSAVLARSTTVGDYVATTSINTGQMPPGALAGLSAYGDHENALGASVIANRVTLWRLEKGTLQTVAETNAAGSGSLFLRMTARGGHLYRFAFSRDSRQWTDVGEELDGQYLPPWDRGVRVALTAGKAPARFNWLRIAASR
jgi:beta-xylosidase